MIFLCGVRAVFFPPGVLANQGTDLSAAYTMTLRVN